MDGSRFDRWTKTMAEGASSRRGVLRLAMGTGLAAIGLGAAAGEALACRKNGKACDDDKKNVDCCSGICRSGKCRSNKAAVGCTVRSRDACTSSSSQVPCPKNPDGFCVLLDDGKPFCAESAGCFDCRSDDECTELADGIPGKCLKTCRACPNTNNRACVFKKSPPSHKQRPSRSGRRWRPRRRTSPCAGAAGSIVGPVG